MDRPVPHQGPLQVRLSPAERVGHVPGYDRVHHARSGRRPQRRRGPHRGSRGHRSAGPRGLAEAVRPLRQRHRGAAARAAGRESSGRGEARLQRSQPGDSGEGAGHQRGPRRLQLRGARGEGPGRAAGARGRRLLARARERRRRRREAIRSDLRGVPEGPAGDEAAPLSRDPRAGSRAGRQQGGRRSAAQGGSAPASIDGLNTLGKEKK